MAAGVNYNNVWASLGVPLDIVRMHKQTGHGGDEAGFHIGGSDASGIVYAVGEDVTSLKVGDRVCNKPFHSCGMCRRCRNGMETACTKRRRIRGGYA